jgi:hypothetical protein
VIQVTTEQRECPWCHAAAGFRDLTSRESMRVMGLTLAQGTVYGALRALKGDIDYFLGLVTSGSEVCCRACNRVVRVCPKCDGVSRWINADIQACKVEGCEQVFV